MNIQNLTEILIKSGIEPNEAKCEIKMLAEHFCDYRESDKLRGKELSEEDLAIIKDKVLLRIKDRLPIQYITGKAWFMGEYFKVTPDVLIPRDETEILVSEAIKIINKHDLKSVLDIGTGSGCIACTIAKRTNATVLGIDISNSALRVALENVTALNINNQAVFRKSDIYDKIHPEEKFDIIISNPPYIPYNTELDAEVRHEPALALFANDNGLEYYKKILEKAPCHLNSNGYITFELGISEAESVKDIMSREFREIEILKDLAGIDRVIIGKLIK